MKTLARCTVAAFVLTAATAFAQMAPATPMADHGSPVDGKPLASPAARASATVAGKDITIHYNTPSMRSRKIMGGLVLYGQVWRTGANPATSLVTAGDLKIGDLAVPAGNYTLYTLPAAPGAPWMFIINKQTGQWGTVYKQEMDLGRTPMHFKKLSTPQEVMSISFERTKADSTELHVKWETTDEWVKIEAAR